MNYTKEYLEPRRESSTSGWRMTRSSISTTWEHMDVAQLKVADRQVWRTIKIRGIISITGDYGMGKSTFLRTSYPSFLETRRSGSSCLTGLTVT
jgi:ABC-type histidine transport system ATPase subunit